MATGFSRYGWMVIWILLAWLPAGCASVRSQAPAERETPVSVTRSPAPQGAVASDIVEVDRWELEGPFHDTVGEVVRKPVSPWERALQKVADRKPGLVLLSEPMHCVARELGRFYLDRQAQPMEGLRRYIMSRCGSTSMTISIAFLASEVPGEVSDDKLYALWRRPLSVMFDDHLGAGHRAVGIWSGRKEGRAVVLLVSGERAVHLKPVSLMPDDNGQIRLEGELLVPADRLEVLQTRGRFGFKKCIADPNVPLPRFSIRCTTSPQDPSAWIEFMIYGAGREVSQTVLNVLAWPGRSSDGVYARSSIVAEQKTDDVAIAALELVRMINAVRREAGIPPVDLAMRESILATHVAPHYFASVLGIVPEAVADAVAQGLKAGEEVDGIIRYSHFTAAWATHTDNLARVLESALERPSGRQVLMDPDIRQVAVGAVVLPEHQFMAAVFSSYAMFDREGHETEANAVFDRLSQARQARKGLPPVRIDGMTEQTARAASMIQTGAQEPEVALAYLLEETHTVAQGPVHGWMVKTRSLEELSFPDELLDPGALNLTVAVAHCEDADGQPCFVVLIVAMKERLTMAAAEGKILPIPAYPRL